MPNIVGRRVALLRAVVTCGGERFHEGAELLVLGVWQGKLHVVADDGREIVHLRPSFVAALPPRRPPPHDIVRVYARTAPTRRIMR